MKRWIGLALTLVLLCGTGVFAWAEQPTAYQLGDTMDDFSVTFSDGTETSLYGLLKEKKAVLINFWASWCSPCRREFPAMEQAYNEMSDQIGIIALTCEASDTDEVVLALKEELGLKNLPMGLDTGLEKRFQVDAFPTSVMVDRNGVICFWEAGSIPDKDKFIRLFSAYTAEDYAAPVILSEIPRVQPTVEYPSAQALSEALHIADEGIVLTVPGDGEVWPFVPAADGAAVEATNGDAMETKALLTADVTAEAGEALQYNFTLSCPAVMDSLTVSVDGEVVKYYGGELDWAADHVTFATAGLHKVEIAFIRGSSTVERASAGLRDLKILTGEQAAALDAEKPVKPKTLSGMECAIEPSEEDIRPILLTQFIPESGESTESMAILKGDTLNLRVKIGADVDENVAFVAEGANAVLLANLPYDDQGYLYKATIAPTVSGENPNHAFFVYPSALDMEAGGSQSYTCFATEADADMYVRMLKEMAAAYGMAGYELSWAYADGSPMQAAETEEAPEADGMATYAFAVTDEAGAPVPGVMVQICDDSTCAVAVTDGEGRATHQAAPYPYEIHILKAPDGYAPDTETYVMEEAGGELTVVLKKQ